MEVQNSSNMIRELLEAIGTYSGIHILVEQSRVYVNNSS